MDTALKCLVLAARHRQVPLTVETLKRRHAITDEEVSEEQLAELAGHAELNAKTLSLKAKGIKNAQKSFPAIARLTNQRSVLVVNIRRNNDGGEDVMILDPMVEQAILIPVPLDRFNEKWTGGLVLVDRKKAAAEDTESFGFSWFLQELASTKGILGQIALIAVILHVLNFVAPLFSMVVLDKVISNGTLDTLHVLFGGAVLAVVMQSMIGYLRTMLLLHVTGRVDVKAAELAFDRMMALPLSFFQSTSAGIIAKNMQQIATIREFLTGQLMLTLLEATALFVFLPILWFYNHTLTLLVLGCTVLIAINVVITIPSNRRRLSALYRTAATRDSMLIETIAGIETIKGMALEPTQKREWMRRSAESVRKQFEVSRMSAMTSEVSGFLQRLMTIAIVWVGVQQVLDGVMSAGAMIAFNMLSGRVTGPLVQLVGLVSKYQQAALSVKMLGTILNRPLESARTGGVTPEIKGAIAFESVVFRYPQADRNVLERLSFSIQPGEKIGVVGRSGAGKSTLAKLVQGFYQPAEGIIRVDGFDIREFDLTHLRTSLGIVPQQSFIFRGSVAENIARSQPGASLQEVIQAARLAGADLFIEDLPQGYDTMLEENASNLSGGQKQRLAIARALLPRPRILVMDEATSALDAESETLIMERFPQIAMGRTVINISHRLNLLVSMDRILVLDQGQVVDFAPHRVLVERCELYRGLWFRQNPHLAPPQAAARQGGA